MCLQCQTWSIGAINFIFAFDLASVKIGIRGHWLKVGRYFVAAMMIDSADPN